MTNIIIHGDAVEQLKKIGSESVQTCVTSPPYYGLRDYGVNGQIGLEETPEKFIAANVEVFNEVYRVLKKDGTLWINIGDSYAHSTRNTQSFRRDKKGYGEGIDRSKRTSKRWGGGNVPATGILKPKDLIGIPWMLAFALRASGWYLRQDIIWSKTNPMPESVKDRCTKSHEYIFLLSKSDRYYYDQFAIATDYKDKTLTTFGTETVGYGDRTDLIKSANWHKSIKTRKAKQWNVDGQTITGKANKRSVWSINTKSFPEAHFATFPEELIVDMIRAGSREGDTVLDPFFGAGTTGLVARKLNRNFIGIELNPEYIKIAETRLRNELGLFN